MTRYLAEAQRLELDYAITQGRLPLTSCPSKPSYDDGDFNPDGLVDAAALVAAHLIFKGDRYRRSAIVINLFGFLIIVPFGLVLSNLGLPGIMHMVDETLSLISIFDFPMVLALTLVVPIFVVINLLVAIRLLTNQKSSEPS